MTERPDFTKPTESITFYEIPAPVYQDRTYDAKLVYGGVTYDVTVTERADGSMHIRSHGLMPRPAND